MSFDEIGDVAGTGGETAGSLLVDFLGKIEKEKLKTLTCCGAAKISLWTYLFCCSLGRAFFACFCNNTVNGF